MALQRCARTHDAGCVVPFGARECPIAVGIRAPEFVADAVQRQFNVIAMVTQNLCCFILPFPAWACGDIKKFLDVKL